MRNVGFYPTTESLYDMSIQNDCHILSQCPAEQFIRYYHILKILNMA